ncbi:heat shock protein beta-6-like [Actinia tenebrosa]|uniref:Heat shock protein beta-6-like n=1 Tax=Actinia tenebrosa TaxID=6105 RepID=A0A6P8IQR8_ACTTE|nr:heat shock protein beta-6-like [Actinia tenebrosa]XP_031569294.1 heat shock protein beta-6-like [Actinia tenebrosa]
MDADKILIATFEVKNYKPNEISLKVEGGKIYVDGKHFSEGEYGTESSEFHRTYVLPESVEPSSVSSRVSSDGVLYIEAFKNPPKETEVALVGSSPTSGDVAKIDDKKFTVTLDVSSFSPEEVVVKVLNNELTVRARHESESHGHFTSRQFNRHFVLPKDVDMDSVVSKLGKDGRLHIEATRKAQPKASERKVEIIMDE